MLEVKSVATTGTITVRLARKTSLDLNFASSSTSVGGQSVQNSEWSLDNTDPNYYVLTTNRIIAGASKLSFGLTGIFNPGSTSGTLNTQFGDCWW